jgi:peptidyl-prolyl cis-trans isomerase SurA
MLGPFRYVLSVALLATGFACLAPPAGAVVVERVVAVVGDRPILQSELRARAKPYLIQIARKMPPGPSAGRGGVVGGQRADREVGR